MNLVTSLENDMSNILLKNYLIYSTIWNLNKKIFFEFINTIYCKYFYNY